MNSLNSKLKKNYLKKAGKIYNFILTNKGKILTKILNNKKSEIIYKIQKLGASKVDYIECIDLKKKKISKDTKTKFNIFIAYYIQGVRLIDNL